MKAIDVLHLLLNNILDLQGKREKKIPSNIIYLCRPGSAHGGASVRLGPYRPESRAYGNFDHQQAIHTNRHGNLLVLISIYLNNKQIMPRSRGGCNLREATSTEIVVGYRIILFAFFFSKIPNMT
jgi:hypothetical protein